MEDQIVKLKGIKPGSIIKVDIGTGYYERVQSLLISFIGKDPAKAIKAIEDLKTREPQDTFEYDLLTILTLIYSIEAAAAEQDLMVENNYKVTKN